MLNEIIESNVNAIVDAFVHKARAYDLPPRDADHAEVMDSLHGYVLSVAAALRTARPEPTPRTDENAKAHGLQRWLLGYDLKSVILEYGVLRSVILEVVEGVGYPLGSRELDEVAQILYSGAADAAVEFTTRATQEINDALATAQAAVRAHEEIVAIVSHDLKNPLNVIQGSAAVLEHVLAASELDAAANGLLRGGVARIGRASVRMNRLITDLLDLARIKEGRIELSLRDEATADLVAEAFEQSAAMAEKQSIRLVKEDTARVTVPCDRDRLMQVFENIMGNAIKFSPAGSNVRVGCTSDGETCTFSVRDEGPGIPADQLPMLFERFWMAPRSDTSVGTGLGLAIAKGIVEAHHGRIWVESVVGKGTAVFFAVPLRKPTT
jgi:signal transduction histidine kinase